MVVLAAVDDFRGHVVWRAGAIARLEELGRGRDRQPEVDQFERLQILRADEIARADVVVDIAGLMDGSQRFGRLPQEIDTAAFQAAVAGDDDRIQPRPVEKFQHDIVLAGGRHAEFQRLDDSRMMDRLADFAFARFLEAFEAGFECGRLFRIEQFQADDLAALLVAGHVERRHGAGDRFAHATRIAWRHRASRPAAI